MNLPYARALCPLLHKHTLCTCPMPALPFSYPLSYTIHVAVGEIVSLGMVVNTSVSSSLQEFEEIFLMSPPAFLQLPKWKRCDPKRFLNSTATIR